MPTLSRLSGGAVAVVVAAGAVVAAAPAAAAPAAPPVSSNDAPIVTLLTDGGTSITPYRVATSFVGVTRTITGLVRDTALVGIDYRVQDGQLYGVGNQGGLYRIATSSGAAKKIRNLSVALDGTRFGVDFNPAANALRIVSDTGQNLRQSFAAIGTPTAVDGALNYTAGTTAAGIVAAAYTNNDLTDTTGTTLFDIDAALDQVVIQAPANSGSLSVTGKLGADVTDIGFDIFTQLSGGRASGNVGYAVVPGETSSTLHQVALLTGEAPVIRTVPVVARDLAVQLVPQVA